MRGSLVPVVYMIESDLLQVQIVVDRNNIPDTNLSMGQHYVMVTVTGVNRCGKVNGAELRKSEVLYAICIWEKGTFE
jgi:hypothetical protein